METSVVVVIDPEIMNGIPCFAGTRVPVQTLLDYLENGDSLNEFLEDFPTVSRAQSIAFLEQATTPAEKAAVLDADTYIRERAARGSREKFDSVLAKVPDVEPEAHDRL